MVMSATIVDIQEYRKKNAASTAQQEGGMMLGEQVEIQIEFRIPPAEEKSPAENAANVHQGQTEQLITQYKSDLREDFARLEKIIRRTLRNMELRMTVKIAVMFVISICISSLIIISAL
jgi:hypothetical protein